MSTTTSPRTAARATRLVALAVAAILLLVTLDGVPRAAAISVVPGEEVTVATGTLQGSVALDHREFLGVPFAAPPTGERRFAPPQPAAPWAGERSARSSGPACPQAVPVLGAAYPSSEDCLYLDVYTPPAWSSSVVHRTTPVMVWIYGGAYALGDTRTYDTLPLVTRGDVITVELSYRVGPFGFLALPGLTGASGATGNWGLQDQALGLRWVHDNIAAFGGDPSNITVFGESAGGNSVCQQLVNPATAGTFAKAIVQSGACGRTGLSGVPRSTAYATGATYAAEVGCPVAATQVSCLRGRTTAQLLSSPQVQFSSMKVAFTPVVDGVTVPQRPVDAFAAGAYHHVPIMIGGQHDEGRLFVALFHHLLTLSRVTPTQYEADVRTLFGADTPRVLAAYPPSDFTRIRVDAGTDLAEAAVYTDGLFACRALEATRALAANPGQRVYAYEFTDPDPAGAGIDPLMPLGAFHASDVIALRMAPALLDTPQRALSDRMLGYWLSFARSGSPDPVGSSGWRPFSPTGPGIFPLDRRTTTSFGPARFARDHRCGFWATVGG